MRSPRTTSCVGKYLLLYAPSPRTRTVLESKRIGKRIRESVPLLALAKGGRGRIFSSREKPNANCTRTSQLSSRFAVSRSLLPASQRAECLSSDGYYAGGLLVNTLAKGRAAFSVQRLVEIGNGRRQPILSSFLSLNPRPSLPPGGGERNRLFATFVRP